MLTYGYGHRNQLVLAERRTTDEGTLELRAEYRCDAQGSRIEKRVDEDGDTTWDQTLRFALDGWKTSTSPLSPYGRGVGGEGFIGNENVDVLLDLDGNGSLTTRYLRGDVVDQLFARVDGVDPYWYLTDRQGSIRQVLDETGAVVKSLAYDGYGNITSETGSGDLGRYAYTGREFDVEIGMQYNRARYYDAATGRWTSQDPLGYDAGDSNLYRYVGNNASGATDPSGYQTNGLGGEGGGWSPNNPPYYWNRLRHPWERFPGPAGQPGLTLHNPLPCQIEAIGNPDPLKKIFNQKYAGLDVGPFIKAALDDLENTFNGFSLKKKLEIAYSTRTALGSLAAWDIVQFYNTENAEPKTLGWVKGKYGQGKMKSYVTVNGEVHFAGAVNYIWWGRLNKLFNETLMRAKQRKISHRAIEILLDDGKIFRHPNYYYTLEDTMRTVSGFRSVGHTLGALKELGISERIAWTKVGWTGNFSHATPFKKGPEILPSPEIFYDSLTFQAGIKNPLQASRRFSRREGEFMWVTTPSPLINPFHPLRGGLKE